MSPDTLAVVLLLLVAATTNAKPITSALEGPMLQMLDDMEQLMTGGPQYDREFYVSLRNCMSTYDIRLTSSQDNAWQGIMNYWNSNGTDGDSWGSTMTAMKEQNATATPGIGMVIYEPCNYASNVAYYHDANEMCERRNFLNNWALPEDYVNGIGKAFSGLAVASSFYHMSHTKVGALLDGLNIGVLSYLIHQGSLSALSDASTIVTDFQNTSRSLSSLEIVDDFMDMYANETVYDWFAHADSTDIPDYYYSFAGIVGTVLTLGFEDEVVDALAPILAGAFDMPPEIYEFVMEMYLPEIRNLTQNVTLGMIEKTTYLKNVIGAITKLIYAFLWQEEYFTNNPIFLNETVNMLGWQLLPIVNTKINNLNSFDYYEVNFQNGTNIYPGDTWCNPLLPHAKWHLESGIGLLDLVYLADEISLILQSAL